MKKNVLTLIALISVFALVLAGCGGKEPAETTGAAVTSPVAGEAGLTSFQLSASTWSSPNGATVHLTAAADGTAQSAAFLVRLEGEDVANIPCQWDGTQYTASAELNAADGYCYYIALTNSDGTVSEVALNTPSQMTYEPLVNMAAALESYCHVMVEATSVSGSKLTIDEGSVQVQAPRITNEGETITVSEAALVLSFNGQEQAREELTLNESGSEGAYELALSGVSFQIPEMENDQQLNLTLNVTLSNGQSLFAEGGTFFYNDGELLTAVG